MRALFDVNVLIALLDEQHLHHAVAYDWLRNNGHHGWATSPITQNGCMRILSQPRYPNPLALRDVRARLAQAVRSEAHLFIPDNVSLLDDTVVEATALFTHRQLTDVYLLALAVAHDCRLVTFDRALSASAVRDADDRHLVQL